jgi:hypothetical protein
MEKKYIIFGQLFIKKSGGHPKKGVSLEPPTKQIKNK